MISELPWELSQFLTRKSALSAEQKCCESCGRPSNNIQRRWRSDGIPGVSRRRFASWECAECRKLDDIRFWNLV